jgi:predicted O-methyltransferase YrrM
MSESPESQQQWTAVDRYFAEALVRQDAALESVFAANSEAGLPAIDVTAPQGKLLYLLAKLQEARRILEIGTLGGYSTIWMARALPAGGLVVTLEAEPAHAEAARKNIERAGVAGSVRIVVGNALDSLPKLKSEGAEPFDMIFIDADKSSTPEYYAWALKFSRPGTVILTDNVVRKGEVANPRSRDASVKGMRRFIEILAKDRRVEATGIQTVGAKGYDGFVIARVLR